MPVSKGAKKPAKKGTKKEALTHADVLPTPDAPTLEANTPQPANPRNLPLVYSKFEIIERSTDSKAGPIRPRDVVSIMDWQTEPEYQARMLRENPDSKVEDHTYGDQYHCRNVAGEKVRCLNNGNNRPLDMDWVEGLVHTLLYGNWAGPLTLPGETINGETVRLSRYAEVYSGQHQLTALKLADEFLQRARSKGDGARYPFWEGKTEVVLETILVRGLSGDERVLRTIDYVKPRTVADMLYTMDVYRKKLPNDRRELTKLLATAIDTLWKRTQAKGYGTHPEITAFLERHPRLLKCVEHIFVENARDKGCVISTKARINPGIAAALCYLMGASGPETDGDSYYNMMPPDETAIDWYYWDRARKFWSQIGKHKDFEVVREAMVNLVNSRPDDPQNRGCGGKTAEKLALFAKVWTMYADHPDNAGAPFCDDDSGPDGQLRLNYNHLDDKGNVLPDGRIKLLDIADFGGVDRPDSIAKKKRLSDEPDEQELVLTEEDAEEVEKAKEEMRQRREAQRDKLLAQRGRKGD